MDGNEAVAMSPTAHPRLLVDVPSRPSPSQERTRLRIDEFPTRKVSYTVCKRILDLVIAVLILPVIIPLCAIIAIICAIISPGPVFYGHRRVGQHGRYFMVWKFRTMHVNGERVLARYFESHPEALAEWQLNHKLQHDPRVTRFGCFLRRTSLDELPQLLNVFSGDMSLVGPRPIVEQEIEKYAHKFHFYTCAKPGITGLWQVSGRCSLTYDERVALDERYVAHWTFWLDLKILLRTFRTVIRAEGAF